MSNRAIRNCISIDVEGFVESNLQSFPIPEKYISKQRENYEIEKNVNDILSLLDSQSVKGTFFFLGRLAKDTPQIIIETARLGHEIACHSFEHKRVFGITKEEFKEKILYAKKSLEDVSGYGVYGFRAPDFSITRSNLWALDILKETGFLYDSSIYPIGMHDVYGVPNAKHYIHKRSNGLIEFPLATAEIFGRRFPFGGGGYFRLYPLALTKFLIRQTNKQGHPCMVYLHPYEIGPEIPYIREISSYRRFRHYYNSANGNNRLQSVFKAFQFCTAFNILKQMNLLL